MKKFVALALVTLGLLIAVVSNSDATTTFANGTAGVDNSNQPYTPVIGTSTTDTEAAPTSATAGHSLIMSKSTMNTKGVVVTVKAHILVTSNDAGVYNPGDTGAGGPAINTFSSDAKLNCWVLDNANGNTTWTRFPAGDKTLEAGATTATFAVSVSDLPRVRRFALIPSVTNVPVIVTYSER
jgi:hypothetical protein